MTSKKEKLELLDEYYPKVATLKFKAEKAFGSRATHSENHSVSRAYTAVLKEYAEKNGSLLLLAQALEVTYPALRRRVMTADIAPLSGHGRSTATQAQYAFATETLSALRKAHDTKAYHDAIKNFYNEGLSVTRMAKELGLKSAYPLYYGLNKSRMRDEEGAS